MRKQGNGALVRTIKVRFPRGNVVQIHPIGPQCADIFRNRVLSSRYPNASRITGGAKVR